MKQELKWIVGVLLLTLILIGILTSFQFKAVDMPLHDTYLLVQPSLLFIYLFILLTQIIFTIRVCIQHFKVKSTIFVLLFANIFMFAILISLALAIKIFLNEQVGSLKAWLSCTFSISLIFSLAIVLFEIFLMRQFLKLQKNVGSS